MTSHPPPTTVDQVQPLFRPFAVGGLELPNRIVMAPMTRGFSPGGVPGADVADYYARRATGGTALIVTEGTYIDHATAGWGERVPRFHGEHALAGWQHVARAVHAAGGRIAAQLWHVGTRFDDGMRPPAGARILGPSGLGADGRPIAGGRAMSEADLADVIDAYARAAGEAERRGFDAVEIHAAHGYLIDSFLWSTTNRRTDGYGGDPHDRTRLAREVVAAVRGAVSPTFPVMFRFSQWKMDDYAARLAHTPHELERLLTPLVEAGVDVFHASTRHHLAPEFEDSGLTLAGWTRKLTGRPTIAVGSVGLNIDFMRALAGAQDSRTDLEGLLARLDRDEFDLIAVGRSLLADPGWAEKIRTGRPDQVTPFTRPLLGTLH